MLRTRIATAALGAVLSVSCVGSYAVAAPAPSPSPTATTAPASAPTTPAKPTPAPAKPKPVGTLRMGSKGPQVLVLQKRLRELKYWVGTPNGTYDHTTAQAVMAFQKVAGLTRDGVAGATTQKALVKGATPKPRSTKGRVLEVDLKRQILMFVVDGKLRYVLNTSTGTKKTPTLTGTFKVQRQIDGWRTAPLGKLYRPKYFFRGYAVHGVKDGNIPGHPASHGCARVSTAAMDLLWTKSGIRVGDTVSVY